MKKDDYNNLKKDDQNFPFKKFPHKEYKDLDDPSKNTETNIKSSGLINYNDI